MNLENSKIILPKKPIPAIPVSHPQISPDGRNILFTYTKVNEEDDKYNSHIWIAPTRGGEPKQFTYGDGNDSTPQWSPDGKEAIFLSNRGGAEGEKKKMQLWIMPADGGEARSLASIPDGIVGGPMFPGPSWSPDSKRVLFLARARTEGEPENKSDVMVIRNLKHKWDKVGFFPDTRVHMFTVDTEGGEPNQLTEGEFDVVNAVWSPDEERIAFVANMTEDTDCSPMKDIWVIPSEGGSPKKIVEAINALWTSSLGWSPDGKHLAFAAFDTYQKWSFANIWALPLEGGEATKLTGGFDRDVGGLQASRLTWSPDSKMVFFASDDGGCRHIYKVSLDAHKVERVTDGKMRIGTFSLSRDGSIIAFNATEATSLMEVWVHDTNGDRRITGLTNDLVKDMTIIEPEEFTFQASDGAEVEGWIMKPVGFKEGERYPAVLQIHGGPWSNYGYNFDLLFQTLAANGYAVVYINHRASTGYGEAFSDITGRWGEREYKDLMEAIDHVIDRYPFVDPDRLGVGGCSGGGYLTNWIVTQTDRFKAAVTVASISNWYSFYGCSDLGPCFILPFWEIGVGEDPWDAEDIWFRPSPIKYVKNVKTPLLIIHGENDLRCPMEQAEQLFIALKKLKKIVEFIRFPGEPHGNVHHMVKPSHTTEAFRHTLRWFNKYLK